MHDARAAAGILTIRELESGPEELRTHLPIDGSPAAELSDPSTGGHIVYIQLADAVAYRLPEDQVNSGRYPSGYLDYDDQGVFFWVWVLALRETADPPAVTGIGYVIDFVLGDDAVFDGHAVDWVAVGTVEGLHNAAGGAIADGGPDLPAEPHLEPETAPKAPTLPADLSVASARPTENDDDTLAPAVGSAGLPDVGQTHQSAEGEPRDAGPRPAAFIEDNMTGSPLRPSLPDDPLYGLRRRIDTELARLAGVAGKAFGPALPRPVEILPGDDTPADRPCYLLSELRYRTMEHSQTWSWRQTSEPDELVYWIVDDSARAIASQWALRAPTAHDMGLDWTRTELDSLLAAAAQRAQSRLAG